MVKIKQIYRKRDRDVHKYDFGSLLIIGGSKIYHGAPLFNALGALRSGVDLVTVVSPERAANIIASYSPDLITYPLKGDYLNIAHIKEIKKLLKDKTGVVIGGGCIGRNKSTHEAIITILKDLKLPCVVDADAIHAVANNIHIIKNKNFVLTPHAYEFFILSGEKTSENMNERIKQVRKFAYEFKTTILLKGNTDIISNGEDICLNKTGTPYMTKGGTGDILAGICGSLLARGIDCFTSACYSAYINGKAGEKASRKYGEGMLASDILKEIPDVIRN
ncbi:MAG: NAD(P)H-hydrate dehydratase [Candidatus Aenigmarchaeota archaeon ex4484_56]|nr:MAG: NAD(P)H-hydrate dehydratase [Candidatus Aenigmarchaeota archaeon ex4484_56]